MANDKSTLFSGNFGLAAKKDFIQNKKSILVGVASLLGAFALFGALNGYIGSGGPYSNWAIFMSWFMASLFITAGASLMFSDMKDKEGRISEVMTPATAMEKYLVRWIAGIPILFALTIGAIYLSDLTRIFVHWVSNGEFADNETYMSVFNPWNLVLVEPTGMRHALIFLMVSGLMFAQAWYFFGAILWPKLSFLKSMFASWCFNTVMVILLIILDPLFPDIVVFDDFEGLFYGSGSAFIVCAIAMYVLTYVKYKRTQVIYKLF